MYCCHAHLENIPQNTKYATNLKFMSVERICHANFSFWYRVRLPKALCNVIVIGRSPYTTLQCGIFCAWKNREKCKPGYMKPWIEVTWSKETWVVSTKLRHTGRNHKMCPKHLFFISHHIQDTEWYKALYFITLLGSQKAIFILYISCQPLPTTYFFESHLLKGSSEITTRSHTQMFCKFSWHTE